MKSSEGLLKGENLKTPLSIFDAIQIKKTEDKDKYIEDKKTRETIREKEEPDSDFLFPISSLF
jgi:hypothetical protein